MSQPYYDSLIWNKPCFPNKINDSEDIVVVTRQDLIILFAKAFGLFGVFFLFLLLRVVMLGILNQTMLAGFDALMFGVFSFLVLIFGLFFHNYYLSLQMVTTDRIIDIHQKTIFKREVNVLTMDTIQDVTYKQKGLWGTVFNFGDVVVQTAGQAGNDSSISGFVFENVPNPSQIAALILQLYNENKEAEMGQQSRLTAAAMQDMLRKNG